MMTTLVEASLPVALIGDTPYVAKTPVSLGRKQLGISRRTADDIREIVETQMTTQKQTCPHCGKSLA